MALKTLILQLLAFCLERSSGAPLVRSSRHASEGPAQGSASLLAASYHVSREGKVNVVDAQRNVSRTMKNVYPWYHTSRDLHVEAKSLASKCNGMMTFKTVKDGAVSIDLVEVKKASVTPVNRVFILFGEHARELVSPESGLHFLRVLCGAVAAPTGAPSPQTVLEESSFQLVLNGNPRSRLKVEEGDFCLRTNPSGVDLNRNWDEMWKGKENADFGDIVNPGPKPFSEPETRIFKQLVSAFKPTTFLTVHSGTRGLYMPWAYDMKHLANRNEPAMMQVLKELDAKHCQCPFGAAGKEVGYSCPGTCLDWVYDKLKTPYSFAFEIYTNAENDADLKERWQAKLKSGGLGLLQGGEHLGHDHFQSLFQEHHSDFVHHSVRKHKAQRDDADSCFGLFNPDTKEMYDTNVANWASTYLELATKIAEQLKKSPETKATSLSQP